jgi:hypothetical protein
MESAVDQSRENNSHDRLNDIIAVCVALLAAFMAVTKVKDDNIVQAMLQAKSDAVDTWSEYQAKKIKHHLLEVSRDQAQALLIIGGTQVETQLTGRVRRYDEEIGRYQEEERRLQDKAKGYEEQYDALNYKDDQFDLSDASLSIALGMLAVTALTKKRWLLYVSLVFAGFGVVMGSAGLMGLNLHPDWLTRLLS